MSVSRATTPIDRPAGPAGRHRRAESAAVRIGRAVDVAARLGSLVMLASVLALAVAAVGLIGNAPVGDDVPTITVTFDHVRR